MAPAIAASASKTTAHTDAPEPDVTSGLCWASPERLGEANAFISDVYRLHHNASISNPYQRLLTLRDHHGALVATTGLRRADEGPLMVEHYLEAPVETVLATRGLCALEPPRHQIMEVGALASASPGAGRRLMLSLVVVLERLGIEWLVVTASRDVRNGLARLGIEMHTIGRAHRHCLDNPADWGRYYERDPRVVVIRPLEVANSMRATPLGALLLAGAAQLAPEASDPVPALPRVTSSAAAKGLPHG